MLDKKKSKNEDEYGKKQHEKGYNEKALIVDGEYEKCKKIIKIK